LTKERMTPEEILDLAISEHNPSHVFALFSGGHDSLVNTHITMQHPRASAVIHIDTGIGIPQTQDFVRETCAQYGWDLLIYRAVDNVRADGTPDPQVYEDLVTEFGFPGPGHHQKMYSRLKGRQVERLVRDHKTHRTDRILLATGLRQNESLRRMAYSDPVTRVGAQLWVNPIFYWSGPDCTEYMAANGLKRNEVKDLLCMSGECLCGAYASEGELDEIETFFPKVGSRLRDLEKRVRAAGFPWGWNDAPPAWWSEWKRGQNFLPNFSPESLDDSLPLPLCSTCQFKHERRTDVKIKEDQ